MINNTVLRMLSVLNDRSIKVLDTVYNFTLETSQFNDLNSLNELSNSGWIRGLNGFGDDTVWIMTPEGRKLYEIIDDIII